MLFLQTLVRFTICCGRRQMAAPGQCHFSWNLFHWTIGHIDVSGVDEQSWTQNDGTSAIVCSVFTHCIGVVARVRG